MTITADTRYLVEPLYTDTRIWEIVARTPKTLTIRPCSDGEVVASEHRDGNPFPVVHVEAVPNESASTRTVRLRKDGTYAVAGGRPLRAVTGRPARRIDYRY